MYLDIKAINFNQSILIHRKKDLTFSTVDDEVIMLHIENEEYYHLNKVGSRIWHILETPISFKELISQMREYYEVDNESVYISDIHEFICELYELKLIEIKKVTD